MDPRHCPSVLALSTAGRASMDGRRMRRLCSSLRAEVVFHEADRQVGRRAASGEITRLLESRRWDLVYLEGTGIVGGLPLLRAARRRGQRFVVSSGDPIEGFFRVTRGPLIGGMFGFYERALYRASACFVGWTPYLVGAALRLGARHAITIEGAVDLEVFRPLAAADKLTTRARFGLPANALVCGAVGSLTWNSRQAYCYGLELIETLKLSRRTDLHVLIVGDGSGRARLEAAVPDALRSRITFTGRLAEEEVVRAMNAMNIGFVTQTLDALGNFRLTTKLPEYLACGLPVAMSAVPGFYDYAAPAGWALPAFHPAARAFHVGCAAWLDGLESSEVNAKANRARQVARDRFDYAVLEVKFRDYIHGLIGEGVGPASSL